MFFRNFQIHVYNIPHAGRTRQNAAPQRTRHFKRIRVLLADGCNRLGDGLLAGLIALRVPFGQQLLISLFRRRVAGVGDDLGPSLDVRAQLKLLRHVEVVHVLIDVHGLPGRNAAIALDGVHIADDLGDRRLMYWLRSPFHCASCAKQPVLGYT